MAELLLVIVEIGFSLNGEFWLVGGAAFVAEIGFAAFAEFRIVVVAQLLCAEYRDV